MVITNQLVTVIGTQRQHIVVVWYDINLLPMKNVTERVKRNYVAPAGREWGEESLGINSHSFFVFTGHNHSIKIGPTYCLVAESV